MIDEDGFRAGIAIIIVNHRNLVLWAKRIGQQAWQFPQGGLIEGESPEQAMYRELKEEVGLSPEDVELLTCSKEWLEYRLPKKMIRYYSQPLCIGQRQKWYLLRLVGSVSRIRFDLTGTPEFDAYRWVKFWYPLHHVIHFKRRVYRQVLKEFSRFLFVNPSQNIPLEDNNASVSSS